MLKLRRCGGARRHWGRVILTLLAGRLAAADLALQISNETAPAGGWVQAKVSAVTPQLVATGRIVMKFDPAVFGSIADVAIFSAQGDAQGVATVNGESLDLPVLTVKVPVLDTARAGAVTECHNSRCRTYRGQRIQKFLYGAVTECHNSRCRRFFKSRALWTA